jgi:hypothetical protein
VRIFKMPKTKYGRYVKKLKFKDDPAGIERQVTQLSGKPFGVDFHIKLGTFIAAGKIGKEPHSQHSHDFNQIMLFMGVDTNDMGELGAEVELNMGEEGEKYMITTSSSVYVPKGLAHFPATINRMDKRFIYMEVSCASEYKEKAVPFDKNSFESAPIMGWKGKYKKHITDTAFIRKGTWHYGPRNRDDSGGSLAFIYNRDPEEFEFLIFCESLKKAPYRFGPIPDKPHAHPRPEILFFLGTDTDNLGYLGAEVEMCLGKEMEKHVITEPTAVVVPKGLAHNPLIIKKIERPFILTDVRPYGSGDFGPGKL